MTALSKIDREVAELERQKDELEKRRQAAIKRKMIKCEGSVVGNGCGRKTQIGKLVYLDFNWYEEPWGCTGGACWHSGEGHFICPKCGRLNRMYNREEWQKLRWYFKDRTDVYGRDDCASQVKAIQFVFENQDFSDAFWKRWEKSGGDLSIISGSLGYSQKNIPWRFSRGGVELPLKKPGKKKTLGEMLQEEFGRAKKRAAKKRNGKKQVRR